jgi:hypothetical protein
LAGLIAVTNVAGAMRVSLDGDSPASRLAVRSARVDGVEQDKNVFIADVTGTLNCATCQLETRKC